MSVPIAERLLWSYDFAHIDLIYRRCAPGYAPPPEVMRDRRPEIDFDEF